VVAHLLKYILTTRPLRAPPGGKTLEGTPRRSLRVAEAKAAHDAKATEVSISSITHFEKTLSNALHALPVDAVPNTLDQASEPPLATSCSTPASPDDCPSACSSRSDEEAPPSPTYRDYETSATTSPPVQGPDLLEEVSWDRLDIPHGMMLGGPIDFWRPAENARP